MEDGKLHYDSAWCASYLRCQGAEQHHHMYSAHSSASPLLRSQLDLIKSDADSLESIAAYALYYLAVTEASTLERWPSVQQAMACTVDTMTSDIYALSGRGTDAFYKSSAALKGDSGGTSSKERSAAETAERWAGRLLAAAAMDLKMQRRVASVSPTDRGSAVPDTHAAARRVLSMLRRGDLGNLCLDMHPPCLEQRVGKTWSDALKYRKGQSRTRNKR